MDDAGLIAKYYGCHEKSFGTLYERHQRLLFGYLRRSFRCPIEFAEDIAEETFFLIARGKSKDRGRFDPARNPSPQAFLCWQLQIARNIAFSELKKRNRLRYWEGGTEGDREDDEERNDLDRFADLEPSSAPDEILQSLEISDPIDDCLGRLSEKHRDVVSLRAIEMMDMETVARLLDIPQGTVGTRLHHAIKILRNCLEGKGFQLIPLGSKIPSGASTEYRFKKCLLLSMSEKSRETV